MTLISRPAAAMGTLAGGEGGVMEVGVLLALLDGSGTSLKFAAIAKTEDLSSKASFHALKLASQNTAGSQIQ